MEQSHIPVHFSPVKILVQGRLTRPGATKFSSIFFLCTGHHCRGLGPLFGLKWRHSKQVASIFSLSGSGPTLLKPSCCATYHHFLPFFGVNPFYFTKAAWLIHNGKKREPI
jgi:hypothetical protein